MEKEYKMYLCPNCEEPNSCNGNKCPYCTYVGLGFKEVILNSEKDKFKSGFFKLSESVDELIEENKLLKDNCEQEKQRMVNQVISYSKEITKLKES